MVCRVPAGTSVFIIGALDAEGWYQVSYKNDKGTHKGYMMAKYISVPSISTGNIGTSSDVLRSSADSSSEMLCVIPEGDKVSVLAALGDWYQVEYDDKIGYVDANCVESEALSKSKGYGTVSVDTLNVRAKRNIESNVVTKMSKGTTFRITSAKDGWYGVTFNGVSGYAQAEYVTATDTIDSGYVQVTSQTLKLRSGAGTDYDQLAIVPYGTVLKIHGSLGSWYQVKYSGKEGYVCGDYTSATTSSGYKAYPDFAKVTASALHHPPPHHRFRPRDAGWLVQGRRLRHPYRLYRPVLHREKLRSCHRASGHHDYHHWHHYDWYDHRFHHDLQLFQFLQL